MKLRKVFVPALMAALVLSLSGGGGSSEEKQTEKQKQKSVVQETEAVTETAEELSVSSFGNVGNDPNNIYQTMYSPAFDGEHIYYSEREVLMRANLDGSEAIRLGAGGQFLNVCDGYLYYGESSSSAARINRINLETFEKEQVAEFVGGNYEHPEFTSMLIIDGYLFFGLENSGAGYSQAGILNLETLESYTGFYSGQSGSLGIKFTVSGDTVYALIKETGDNSNERQVYQLPLSEVPNYGSFQKATNTSNFGPYNSVVFAPDGIYRMAYSSTLENDLYYYKAYFSEIDEEEQRWGFISEDKRLGQDIVALREKSSELAGQIYSKNPRFMFGDTMLMLTLSPDVGAEIYRYENFDYKNGQKVGEANVDAFFFNSETAAYGVYEDSLYLIEMPEDGAAKVIRIREDGTVTESEETLSAEQPQNVSVLLHSGESEEFTYDIYSNHASITSYKGSAESVTVPAELEGQPVTEIGKSAFEDKEVTAVVLPESMERIGDYAFNRCYSLTDINIPASVTYLGYAALSETAITELVIPEGVTEISDVLCSETATLTKVTIPEGVTSIGTKAFDYTALTSVTIPSSVTVIGDQAFNESHLASVILPEGLETIGEYAFNRCYSLTSITIPSTVNYMGKAALSETAITELVLPESLMEISDALCSACHDLENVTISGSVQRIGECAFEYCGNLAEVYFPDNVQTVQNSAFQNSGLQTVKGSENSIAPILAENLGYTYVKQ